MGIYFNISSNWWIVLGIIYAIYFAVYVLRKNKKNDEPKKQLMLAVIVLVLAFVVEFSGVSLGLWTYIPGNWPVAVWIGYFGVGLAGYQIAKFVDEYKK